MKQAIPIAAYLLVGNVAAFQFNALGHHRNLCAARSLSVTISRKGDSSSHQRPKFTSQWATAASAGDDGALTNNRSASSSDLTETSMGGSATILQEVFNLVKAIVGAGVLALPAGIASFGNAPSAMVPAVALITVIGILSGYGFALIGRTCALTGAKSFREAWSASLSEKSSWLPAWSVTLKTFFAILAYSMILAETFQSILTMVGFSFARETVLSGVTLFLLLPLCLLRDLSALAPFSLLGSLGMIYTAAVMIYRWTTKAYQVGGMFGQDMPSHLQPAFGMAGASAVWSPTTSILVGMLSTAYMAHFNAPKFYTELKNATVPRYVTVVSTSFAVSIALFVLIAGAGFLTFGGNASGLILNNYSSRDTWMGLSRLAVALSLVFSYPLAFTGAREGILDLFQIKKKLGKKSLNLLTVGLLGSVTAAAAVIPDVSFVLAFAG